MRGKAVYNRRGIGWLRMLFVLVLLFLGASGTSSAQTSGPQANQHVAAVACSVRTDHSEWGPTRLATVTVTVESLSDRPFQIPVWSVLSLAPVSPRGDPRLGKLVAGIDPSLVDQFLPQRVRPSRAAKGDGSIRLRFLRKGEQATFKLDARDLIWDYEAVNREPGFKLFSLAKPGEYELRFHMWWENGACDSAPSSLKVAGEAGK